MSGGRPVPSEMSEVSLARVENYIRRSGPVQTWQVCEMFGIQAKRVTEILSRSKCVVSLRPVKGVDRIWSYKDQ